MPQTISTQTRKRIDLLPDILKRLEEHEENLSRINKFLFTGDVEKNEPSLSERIRNIEKILTSMSRVVWIATTALVGAMSIYAWEQLIK